MTIFFPTVDLVQSSLPKHLDDCTGSHLLLALNKIQEQQSLICKLCDGVKTLEQDNKKQLTAFATLQATVTAAEAAVIVSEKRLISQLHAEVSKMNQKVSSEISALNSQSASNVRHLQERVAEITRDVATIKNR
jgi:thiamine biosynthesis lipoprotein ApbE